MGSGRNKSLTIVGGLLLAHGTVQADVVTDGTMGAASNLAGPNYTIDASLGIQTGSNLFHSFSEFSVASGESATFNGPASVNNIISRVTGRSASRIDGALRSTIRNAALYLINPKGVLFGKDAQLDVPGSLYVSTADQIGFADGKVFSTSLDGADMLTVAAPASFGFLTPSPANIQINAENLAATSGGSLNFVGGDIDISIAASGQLGINADSGEIDLVSSAGGHQIDLDHGRPTSGGQAGGKISLGGHTAVQTHATNGRDAGDIRIQADYLNVADQAIIRSVSDLGSAGNSGSLRIQVNKDMALSGNAVLATGNAGSGHAGSIEITADEINLVGSGKIGSATSFEEAVADTGSIRIMVNNITLSENAEIFAHTLLGSGDAGVIEIQAGQIQLGAEASILSGTLSGSGGFGEIHLKASQSIGLIESARITGYNSSDVDVENGGNIYITTPYLSIDSARVAVITTSNLVSPAGTVRINSDQIYLTNGATIMARNLDTGNPGNITINGNGRLEANESFIIAKSGGADGGNVNINTQLVVLDSSHISADSNGASGGRLNIQSTLVRTPDSTTTAHGVAQAQDGEVLIADEINPDQVLLDLELGFLANEVKAPCSVAVAEGSVVLNVNAEQGCRR